MKGLEDELSAKRGDEEKNTETIKKLEEEMKVFNRRPDAGEGSRGLFFPFGFWRLAAIF